MILFLLKSTVVKREIKGRPVEVELVVPRLMIIHTCPTLQRLQGHLSFPSTSTPVRRDCEFSAQENVLKRKNKRALYAKVSKVRLLYRSLSLRPPTLV